MIDSKFCEDWYLYKQTKKFSDAEKLAKKVLRTGKSSIYMNMDDDYDDSDIADIERMAESILRKH